MVGSRDLVAGIHAFRRGFGGGLGLAGIGFGDRGLVFEERGTLRLGGLVDLRAVSVGSTGRECERKPGRGGDLCPAGQSMKRDKPLRLKPNITPRAREVGNADVVVGVEQRLGIRLRHGGQIVHLLLTPRAEPAPLSGSHPVPVFVAGLRDVDLAGLHVSPQRPD